MKPYFGVVHAAPAFAMALALAACSADQNSNSLPDSGKSDAGLDVQHAGPAADSDGATPSGDDGGASLDAPGDGGSLEVSGDGGGSFLCATMSFADCGTFTDWTDATDRTILFKNYQYDPRCVQVRPGQSVAFRGDFVVHPLAQACGPSDIIEHRLPINASPGIETSAAFTLPEAGLYGYYCLDHGNAQGVAMAGAILVSQ